MVSRWHSICNWAGGRTETPQLLLGLLGTKFSGSRIVIYLFVLDERFNPAPSGRPSLSLIICPGTTLIDKVETSLCRVSLVQLQVGKSIDPMPYVLHLSTSSSTNFHPNYPPPHVLPTWVRRRALFTVFLIPSIFAHVVPGLTIANRDKGDIKIMMIKYIND